MAQLDNVRGCTIDTCPLSYATVDYIPTLWGNALYLSIFALFLLIQAFQLFRYRTWSYSVAMISGLVLEVVGYLGRVMMHYNPFDANPFLIYLICLTIGPVFFAAAIYLTLSRIIVYYGLSYARLSPKWISLGFMLCDFIALVMQATGGAIADTAATREGSKQGTHIMVAGLAFQVLTLLGFIAVAAEFAWNVKRDRAQKRNKGIYVGRATDIRGRSERGFKMFLIALSLSTILILTRSSFRVGELANGFGSKLANEEIPFMILEGAMVVLAVALMTVFHPGHVFGAKWVDAGWNWKKAQDVEASGGRTSGSDPESIKN